jgi:hypothetical protein
VGRAGGLPDLVALRHAAELQVLNPL